MSAPSELTNLAAGLGFTLAELELNRAGRLSTAQSWTAYRNAAFSLGVMLVILGLILVMLAHQSSGWQRWILYLFLVAFGVGTVYMCGAQFLGSIQQRVLRKEGPLTFRDASRAGTYLMIENADVEAPGGAKAALLAGKRYRLFYVGRTDTFLSIEPL